AEVAVARHAVGGGGPESHRRLRRAVMARTITAALVLLTLAGGATAQDMALSQVLIDGEGGETIAKGPAGRPQVAAATVPKRVGRSFVLGTSQALGSKKEEPVIILRPAGTPPRLEPQRLEPKDVTQLAGLARPAGIALSPDKGTLYVGDAGGKYAWAYRVDKEGFLSAGQPYCSFRVKHGETACGVTAMTVDTDGRIYATTPIGVQIFDPTGRLSGVLTHPAPGRALTGVAFGGADRKTLFVAAGEKVFARTIKAQGVDPHNPSR